MEDKGDVCGDSICGSACFSQLSVLPVARHTGARIGAFAKRVFPIWLSQQFLSP